MLEVTCNMNSSVENVFACKCCSLMDQNLEIILKNTGPSPVTLAGFLILENDRERMKVATLYPPRAQTVPPGDMAAYYTYMEEGVWERFERLVITDIQGREYRFPK